MENVERTEIQHMLERSDYVEKENRCLKDLLDRAGISYAKPNLSYHSGHGKSMPRGPYAFSIL